MARWSHRRNGNPNEIVNGLYAIGECACVSVHGANRLGTNSLLDLLVFGRAAGNHIIEASFQRAAHKRLPSDAGDRTLARLAMLDGSSSGERTQDVANEIRRVMQAHCGVFRTSELLAEGVQLIARVTERGNHIHLKDKSKVFNTARVEALELANLVERRGQRSFRPTRARRAAAPTPIATSPTATTSTG